MKAKLKLFLPMILICSMLFGSISFASESGSSNYPKYFVKWCLEQCGISLPESVFDSYLDWMVIHLSESDKVHGGGGYSRGEDYISDNITVDGNDAVFSVDIQNTFMNFINDYLHDNPLGYYLEYIYPIEQLNSVAFQDSTYFGRVISDSKNLNSKFVLFCKYPSDTTLSSTSYATTEGSFKANGWLCGLIDGYNFEFYNPSVRQNFVDNSFYIALDWGTTSSTWGSVYSEGKVFGGIYSSSGQHLYTRNTGGINTTLSYNAHGAYNYINNSNYFNIYSTTGKKETVRVFASIDALRIYDSGNPQPYYLTNNFDSSRYFYDSSTISYTNLNNVGNVYNNITENVSSGMSAEQLQTLVNVSVNNYIDSGNGSGGGGSDSDDDDLGFFDKLFGSIGKLLKKIIEGIATIISDVVDGLESIVDSIIGAVESLISWFTDDDSGIFRFLKLFIEWLPEPIPTLLMTFFSLSIIFAVVKLIKGALS